MKEGMRYYKNENNIYRISVEVDDEPESPREWDRTGKMMCWHKGYRLGDENPYKDPDECLDELIREEYSDSQIIRYVKKHETSNNIEIKYDRSKRRYDLIADYTLYSYKGAVRKRGIVDYQPKIEWLTDGILDEMSGKDKVTMLEKQGYFFLPLAIYEHSGITMYIGGKYDHYDGQWDCSDVGFIYVKKQEIFDNFICYLDKKEKAHKINKNNWKIAAEHICRSEVEEYDMFLKGEVYSYFVDKLDTDYIDIEDIRTGNTDQYNENDCWDPVENCCGFYSKKWGEELVKEIADESGYLPNYESLKEVI